MDSDKGGYGGCAEKITKSKRTFVRIVVEKHALILIAVGSALYGILKPF